MPKQTVMEVYTLFTNGRLLLQMEPNFLICTSLLSWMVWVQLPQAASAQMV